MRLMMHPDAEVQKQALLCVQKILLARGQGRLSELSLNQRALLSWPTSAAVELVACASANFPSLRISAETDGCSGPAK